MVQQPLVTPISLAFLSKNSRNSPGISCVFIKNKRNTRGISHVFIKNKRLSSPEQGFTSDWGLHQIRNDAEWFKVEFYKQRTL